MRGGGGPTSALRRRESAEPGCSRSPESAAGAHDNHYGQCHNDNIETHDDNDREHVDNDREHDDDNDREYDDDNDREYDDDREHDNDDNGKADNDNDGACGVVRRTDRARRLRAV
jgi:hypothetical protein